VTAPDRESLKRLGDLIDLVLELPPAERKARLAIACGDDSELFATAWGMIEKMDRAERFMRIPAALSGFDTPTVSFTEELIEPDGTTVTPHSTPVSSNNRPWHWRSGLRSRAAQVTAIAGVLVVGGGITFARIRSGPVTTIPSVAPGNVPRPRAPPNVPDTVRQSAATTTALREVQDGRRLIEQGGYDAAKPGLQHALRSLSEAGYEASLDAADARRLLAIAYAATSHRVEAERELRAALHIYRLHLPDDDVRLDELTASLAALLAASGRTHEADSLQDRKRRLPAVRAPART
jgi:hypothetical protein